MLSYTDITRSTIQGHPGPASLKVQFNVVCKNIKVTTMLAALKEQMDKYKQTLMSSAGVLANEKSNPSPEKTSTPEATEHYESECATLADTLKGLGRELKKLETELGYLTDEDKERVSDFRDELASYDQRLSEMIDKRVKDIEAFFADKAHIDDKDVQRDLRTIVAEHIQDVKTLLPEIHARVKRADPNAPELPKEVIEKSASQFEPVLKAAQNIVDGRKADQAAFEQKAKAFMKTVMDYRDNVDDLMKKFDKVLPGAAIHHVMPLPPLNRSFSA